MEYERTSVPRLMTVNDFAEAASLAQVTVWKWVREGRISSTKLGRARRIPASELTRLIEQGTAPQEAERDVREAADTAAHVPGLVGKAARRTAVSK